MKSFLTLALLILCPAFLYAIEPVTAIFGRPDSKYTIEQSTVSISSSALTTDGVVVGYRKVKLHNLTAATTIFYRVDGSTLVIPTVGWAILPGTIGEIESNQEIHYLLAPTVVPTDFRKMTILR